MLIWPMAVLCSLTSVNCGSFEVLGTTMSYVAFNCYNTTSFRGFTGTLYIYKIGNGNIKPCKVFGSTLADCTEVCRTQLYSFSRHRGETASLSWREKTKNTKPTPSLLDGQTYKQFFRLGVQVSDLFPVSYPGYVGVLRHFLSMDPAEIEDGQTHKQFFPGLVLIDKINVVFYKEKQFGGNTIVLVRSNNSSQA